ncbi:hypothetical protein AB0H57_28320 [Micromonospora sp. NPDC050686]|uniref:hypothetical protein n=1 Tax=Micromonospora sp. NPDC050686 TaxID=3154631 RepID=UPI003411B61D
MSGERFVVHLPVVAADLPAALRFARAITRAVAFMVGLDSGGVTVSTEDAQGVRHWVFCDRLLDRGRRCRGLADHEGPCGSVRHR